MSRAGLLVCVLLFALACDSAPGTAAPSEVVSTTTAQAALASDTPSSVETPAAHHCEGSPAQCGANAAPPMATAEKGGERYGAPGDPTLPIIDLPDLLARPADFANKTVRTAGTVGRVCQQRGCWMELRVDAGDGVARVPMAGHAFFVPKDISGRTAVVEGVVSVREGAENPLRIDATSVLVAANEP